MLLRRRQGVELVGEGARPVHMEVGGRDLEERVLSEHGRDVAVEQVLRRLLLQRAFRPRLAHTRTAVRLELLVVSPEPGQLIVFRQLELGACRVVAQVRIEWIGERTVVGNLGVAGRRFDCRVIADRPEPPQALKPWFLA